jgi:mono/diheme cytochrome c family protein
MSKVVWGAAVAALLLATASGVSAQKIKREPIQRIDGVAGSTSFQAYCAQCHGASGVGNGPVAKALKVPPADLTRIAQRNGGKFPRFAVKQIILGDTQMLPHGTKDMPLWGPVFRSMDSPSVTDLRVGNLVNYIEALQQK